MSAVSRIVCCLALMSFIGADASAQGKKDKPPQKYYGTAVFRCPDPSGTSGCGGTDGIYGNSVSNQQQYAGLGWAGAGLFSGNSEMHIGLDSGGETYYRVWLLFGESYGARPCAGSCRYPIDLFTPIELEVAEIQSNMVNDTTGAEIAGGLFTILEGGLGYSRFRISFRHPNSTLGWHVNFSTEHYAGATHVPVRRGTDDDRCTWVFEAGENERAGLWAVGTTTKGKSYRTDEGLYRMPFKLTFKAYDAPGCPPKPVS